MLPQDGVTRWFRQHSWVLYAAARQAYDDDQLALVHAQAHLVQGDHCAGAVQDSGAGLDGSHHRQRLALPRAEYAAYAFDQNHRCCGQRTGSVMVVPQRSAKASTEARHHEKPSLRRCRATPENVQRVPVYR